MDLEKMIRAKSVRARSRLTTSLLLPTARDSFAIRSVQLLLYADALAIPPRCGRL